jgi:hypothetical protein
VTGFLISNSWSIGGKSGRPDVKGSSQNLLIC